MAKSQKKKNENIQAWKLVAVVSLVVNVLAILAVIILFVALSNRVFDGMIVDRGINKMCSNSFRDDIVSGDAKDRYSDNQKRLFQAQLDFTCGNNGADKYRLQAYDNYIQSIGLKKQ